MLKFGFLGKRIVWKINNVIKIYWISRGLIFILHKPGSFEVYTLVYFHLKSKNLVRVSQSSFKGEDLFFESLENFKKQCHKIFDSLILVDSSDLLGASFWPFRHRAESWLMIRVRWSSFDEATTYKPTILLNHEAEQVYLTFK